MSIYRLDNYLLRCEINAFTGFGGCWAEVLIEQARGLTEVAERAQRIGWEVGAPGPWDEPREYSAMCPTCVERRSEILARRQASREEESR